MGGCKNPSLSAIGTTFETSANSQNPKATGLHIEDQILTMSHLMDERTFC